LAARPRREGGAALKTITDHAADDATEIAKKLQNPVGDLISVPFSNYTNFNVGPNKGTFSRSSQSSRST
jgi:hypothetical protein